MKKKGALLLALLVALLVLAGGYLGLKFYNDAQESATQEPGILLSNLGDVTHLTVTYAGATLDLSKDGDGVWTLDGAGSVALNQVAVQDMADAVRNVTAEQLVAEDDKTLSEYGLQSPQGTVTGRDGEGEEVTFLIGDHLDFNDTYYVKRQDVPGVYSVGYKLGDAVLKTLGDLKAAEEDAE